SELRNPDESKLDLGADASAYIDAEAAAGDVGRCRITDLLLATVGETDVQLGDEQELVVFGVREREGKAAVEGDAVRRRSVDRRRRVVLLDLATRAEEREADAGIDAELLHQPVADADDRRIEARAIDAGNGAGAYRQLREAEITDAE